jgi:TPP-dependent pyruvate/acetoin dehydrogenase alpha subunit
VIQALDLRGKPVNAPRLLAAMQSIRAIESALLAAAVGGRFEGPLHVSLGEEAIAVGVAAGMGAEDVLLSNHRGHGHALACGLDPVRVVAEISGERGGYSHGRGGSMHIFDPTLGFLGTNGIVGGNAGVAMGVGLALQLENRGRAAVVILGDGAMGTGVVYESLNLAAVWSLPILFVCSSNGYAELTPTSKHLSSDPVERAKGFRLDSFRVDGVDVLKVAAAVGKALERVRHGRPGFIEARCFRFGGHYVGDAGLYRPAGEDEQWRREHCPITKLARRLGVPDAELDGATAALNTEANILLRSVAA